MMNLSQKISKKEKVMIMTQPKFMWATIAIKPKGGVKQLANGMTVCDLKDNIQITHNSRKKNRMILIFKEDQKHYLISSDNKLNEILQMYTNLTDLDQKLREYASSNLEEIK